MGVIKALDGNAAIAHGVMRSKVQLVAAYPITPQTPIVETIASLIDKKEYEATYITAESEHSALSANNRRGFHRRSHLHRQRLPWPCSYA